MKKLLILLFTFCISAEHSFCQTSDSPAAFEPTYNYGLKAGVNLSTIVGISSKFMVGAHGGLTATFRESESLGYGIEVLFSHQGGRLQRSAIQLNYIQVPLFLNIYTGRVSFQAGGYVALLFTAFSSPHYNDISGNLNGLDYGAVAGFTFNPQGKIFVSTRINFGLAALTIDEKGRNLNFQASTGLNF